MTWLIRRGKRRRKRAAARGGRRGMSESLADTVALYAAGLALFSLVTAVRGRGLGRAHAGAAVVLGRRRGARRADRRRRRRDGRAAGGAGPVRGLPAAVGARGAGGLALRARVDPRLGRGGARARRRAPCASSPCGSAGRGDERGGPPRLLAGFYVLFAIAAGARSAYQLATRFDEAPVAYTLSALAAAVYVVAAVALRSGRRGLLAAAASVELAGCSRSARSRSSTPPPSPTRRSGRTSARATGSSRWSSRSPRSRGCGQRGERHGGWVGVGSGCRGEEGPLLPFRHPSGGALGRKGPVRPLSSQRPRRGTSSGKKWPLPCRAGGTPTPYPAQLKFVPPD